MRALVAILALASCASVVHTYSCKGLNGQAVDWWYAYKLPDLEDARAPSVSKGLAFVYADSRSGGAWVQSTKTIADPTSAIGVTVSQVFDAKRDQSKFYAMYNDEHPTGKQDSYRGHMKGVLVFDDFGGFWLVHSVPKFPGTSTGRYDYPESGTRNGQSFLCVTFSSADLDDIGKQLLYATPSVYEYHLPASYQRLYPNLVKAVTQKGRLPKGASQYYSVLTLQSSGGARFINFAKHKKFAKDLYADLVAPELKTSLYAETWLNGPNDLTSECDTQYKVYNLRSLKVLQYAFNNSKDHSKWAVSATAQDGWVCVGDINRQRSQEARGGGTMCLANPAIWQLYRATVEDFECCPTRKSGSSSSSRKASSRSKPVDLCQAHAPERFSTRNRG